MFWSKKKQQQQAQPVPGKVALSSDVVMQFRRAQSIDEPLAGAIRHVCCATPTIIACYLLDARNPNTGELGFVIALTVDDEQHDMDAVAQQFQAMLRQFPDQARSTVIMSSSTFLPAYEGALFYST